MVAPDALVHGVEEIRVAVIADSRVLVGSDIGRVQGAERQHEGASAGEGRSAVGGVAGFAIRGARQIFASLDEARALEFRRHAGGILRVILGQRDVRAAREIHGARRQHHHPQEADQDHGEERGDARSGCSVRRGWCVRSRS